MTNIKKVYNERHKIKKVTKGDKTEMHYLISKLEESKYVYFIRDKCGSDTIQDIFWAHPQSVNNFPTVFVMDLTYKIKIYSMPLFEIVEVTSTAMTYLVDITGEKEDNFTWAL